MSARDLSGHFRRWLLNYREGDRGSTLNDDDLEISFHAGYQMATEELNQTCINSIAAAKEMTLARVHAEIKSEMKAYGSSDYTAYLCVFYCHLEDKEIRDRILK